jgi:hypothetical protein
MGSVRNWKIHIIGFALDTMVKQQVVAMTKGQGGDLDLHNCRCTIVKYIVQSMFFYMCLLLAITIRFYFTMAS